MRNRSDVLERIEFVVPQDGARHPEVRSHIIIDRRSEQDQPGILVLPGIGQHGGTPRRIAQKTPGTDVASAAPFWKIPCSAISLEAFATNYPIAAVEAWRDAHNHSSATPQTPNVVLESLEGIGGAMALAASPDHFQDVVYLRPAWFDTHQLGNHPVGELAKRAFRTFLQKDQWNHPWNIINGIHLSRNLTPKMLARINLGLGRSVVTEFIETSIKRSLCKKRTAIAAGTLDWLIPIGTLEKIHQEVGEVACNFIPLEGASHRSMGTSGGAADLAVCREYLLAQRSA